MAVQVVHAPEIEVWRFPNATDEAPQGHLSPSQINQYRDCPRCYYHQRVRLDRRPETVAFAIGGAVHKAVEIAAKAVIRRTPVAADEAISAADQDWSERTTPADDSVQIDLGRFDSLGAAKDEAMRLAEFAVEKLPPLLARRGLIAAEFDLSDLPDELLSAAYPFPVEGRIDFVFGDPNTGAAKGSSDLKTSRSQGGPDDNGVLQFGMYGLPAHMAGAEWQLACDVLAKTKTATLGTYWANGDGYMTDAQYAAIRAEVLRVAEAIHLGNLAHLEGDQRGVNRYFPIGKGWNGRHDYQHDDWPAFSLAVSFPGMEAE